MTDQKIVIHGIDDVDFKEVCEDAERSLRVVQAFRETAMKQPGVDGWPAAAVLHYLTAMGFRVSVQWLARLTSRGVVEPEAVGCEVLYTDESVAELLRWCWDRRLFLAGYHLRYKTAEEQADDARELATHFLRTEYYACMDNNELVYRYKEARENDDMDAALAIRSVMSDRVAGDTGEGANV